MHKRRTQHTHINSYLLLFYINNMSTLIDNSSNNDDESDEDKSMDIFEQFLKYRKKKASRKKHTNSLVHEATRLIEEIQRKNGEPKKRNTKKPLLNCSWEEPLVSKETPLQMPPHEEKERKPPKERTVKPSRTGLCKSGWSTHGPTTKSRNAATKGYNKRIYMTRKSNVGSKK